MNESPKFEQIDAYLAATSPQARPILTEIRRIVQEEAPDAQETISYQMPAFKAGGHTFIYFAAFKKHIGIYPPVKGDAELAQALLPYRGEKGNLKFPLAQPMPYDLIRRVAAALALEYANGFLALLAAPARRALENASITSLKALSKRSEGEILALHGVGPTTMPILRQVLHDAGLAFAEPVDKG